jgi:hypothetical protein
MRSRRQLIRDLGGVLLLSTVPSCEKQREGDANRDARGRKGEKEEPHVTRPAGDARPPDGSVDRPREPAAPPLAKPDAWDPIAYNRDRGNAGAIPQRYREAINGPDGVKKHLGKHLPYQPELTTEVVPEGHLALMWGDPKKGYTRHPNADRGPANDNEGHWYNWVRIRKAVEGDDAAQVQSDFSGWPRTAEADSGKYVGLAGKEIASEQGKNTIYLVRLPKDVKAGDTVRVWAHCLTHGEYVDFLTLA